MEARARAELARLDEETWGERFARARSRSGVTLKEAAYKVQQFMPASRNSIMRLETFDSPPKDQRRRMLAYYALIAFGYEPSDFGLSEDDRPAGVPASVARQILAPPSRSK